MEIKTKKLTTSQVLELSDAVDILFEQDIKYPIDVAYKLFKLKKNLNEASEYIIDNITRVIPKLKDENSEINEDENVLYQTILNYPIEIETCGLERNELYCLDNDELRQKPEIEPSLIENLDLLF
jgi:hypothetical protein